jgi:hypothetical protein
MKLLGKIMLVFALAVCVMFGQAAVASAHYNYHVHSTAPCHGVVAAGVVAAPVYAVPVVYGYTYATAAVSVVPVTTTITYAPSVVLTAYPVVYPAPLVLPRIVTVPTYAVIR